MTKSISLPYRTPEYVQKYATEEALTKSTENGNASSSDESSMSDFSDDETRDMEI